MAFIQLIRKGDTGYCLCHPCVALNNQLETTRTGLHHREILMLIGLSALSYGLNSVLLQERLSRQHKGSEYVGNQGWVPIKLNRHMDCLLMSSSQDMIPLERRASIASAVHSWQRRRGCRGYSLLAPSNCLGGAGMARHTESILE